jgi:hypothetical protein
MNSQVLTMIKEALVVTLGILVTIDFISVLRAMFATFKHLKPVIGAVRAAVNFSRGLIAYIIVGVAFVAMVDFLNGAIKEKNLEETIEVMKKFDEDCIVHLDTARRKIDGINQNIKDGTYKVDDEHIILNGMLKDIA